MSEEAKIEVPKVEEKKEYVLPTPEFPKLELPEDPKVPQPPDGVHMACDGSLPLVPTGQDLPLPPEGKLRILIGVCILSYTHEFVQSFLKFWQQICTIEKGKMQIGYQFMYRRPSHIAENELVKIAQFNKCTHILFIDDDIYDYTLADLHKLIDADKDIISGHMYASKFPFSSCAFRRYDSTKKVIDMPSDNTMYRLYEVPCICKKCNYSLTHWDMTFCPACGEPQDNLVQPVDLIPLPFALVKVSMFDKLKKPYFHCSELYPTDSWLADKCIEAGIQEYCHMGVRLNHAGINDITKPFEMQKNMQLNQAAGDKGLVKLTNEQMNMHQYLLNEKMLEAELKTRVRPDFVEILEPEKEVTNVGTQADRESSIRGTENVEEGTVPEDSSIS